MDEYPLLELFWTMLWFFGFVAWISVLFSVFRDIFVSADLSGWGKAAWTLFAMILPFLGVLIYLIARGGKMHQRQATEAVERERAMAAYIRSVAPTSAPSVADELTKLAHLRDTDVLTVAEYEAQKTALMSTNGSYARPGAAV